MGLFDKIKGKKNVTSVEQEAKQDTGANKGQNETGAFRMGVNGVYRLKETSDMVVTGFAHGTVSVGDAVYLNTFADGKSDVMLTEVKQIEIGPKQIVKRAEYCNVGLRLENVSQYGLRIGTVVFSREATGKEAHNAYLDALYGAYVSQKDLALNEQELAGLNITDCEEVWRMFSSIKKQKEQQEGYKITDADRAKISAVAGALCKKILGADYIYCVYNKLTGEPHLFSETIKHEQGYETVPPDILIFTEAQKNLFAPHFEKDNFTVRKIENGPDKKGIYNFLGSTFYINGACGVKVISQQTSIACGMLVPKPDYSNVKPIEVPVTNPDLVRWLLLMGQMGEPITDEQKLIYSIYDDFLGREVPKATFLIPMKKEGDFETPDETGKITLKEDTQIAFPTIDGKYGRPAIRMFTDWPRLRAEFGEEWNGMVQPIDGIINRYDAAINAVKGSNMGIYVSEDTFKQWKERHSGK